MNSTSIASTNASTNVSPNGRFVRVALAVAFAFAAVGCDGHIRRVYLVEPGSAPPSRCERSSFIVLQKGQNVRDVLAQVASTLEIEPIGDDAYRVYFEHGPEFTVLLKKDKDSSMVLELVDFPYTSRTPLSERVEYELRRRLGANDAHWDAESERGWQWWQAEYTRSRRSVRQPLTHVERGDDGGT